MHAPAHLSEDTGAEECLRKYQSSSSIVYSFFPNRELDIIHISYCEENKNEMDHILLRNNLYATSVPTSQGNISEGNHNDT